VSTSVLLHHRAAARPVDFAFDLLSDRKRDVAVQPVRYPPAIIDLNIDYRDRSDPSGIAGLSAAGWIEGRSIEQNVAITIFQMDIFNARAEASDVRVIPIEFYRHNPYTYYPILC
jgi:hypothetical protein